MSDTMPPTAGRSMTLRVLTLNVWNTDGAPERQELLRAGVAALDADLISLQEVVRTDDYDQLDWILGDTDLHAVHQLDLIDAPSWGGTALASRWAPTRTVGTLLPGRVVGACAIAAVIPLPIGVDLLFHAVKPSAQFDHEADRCRQAIAITALDEQLRGPAPSIIAGDFDATPDADCMRFYTGRGVLDGRSVHFRDAWEQAGEGGPGHTWTSDNPGVAATTALGWIQIPHRRRIDHILVGGPFAHPDVHARIVRCDVVLADPPASDHYGVLAEIELVVQPPH